MIWLLSIVAGLVVKSVGLLGGSGALSALAGYFNNKERQKTQRIGIYGNLLAEAAHAQANAYAASSQERIALWGSLWYRLLVYLIVLPPALYYAAIFGDTLFPSWIPGKIDQAPAAIDALGQGILMTFIGGGAIVSGVTKAMKELRK